MGSRMGGSPGWAGLVRGWVLLLGSALTLTLSGCSGGGDDTPAPPQVVATAPAVTTQPIAPTLAAGSAATFSVAATGTAPLTYQWQRDGANIVGATNASYTIAAVGEGDSGAVFRVIVTNSAGSATSSNSALTVNAVVVAPTIAVAPQSEATLDGSAMTLSVVANGTAPFSYQWQRNAAAIPGATTSRYTTAALSLAESGSTFAVIVSNGAGRVTSPVATVTVNAVAASVGSAPAPSSVAVGQTATFTVAASGSNPLSYQWRRNGTPIAGATSANYTTPATTIADNSARFSVVVSNVAGSATSPDAVLSVSAAAQAPLITTAPQNRSLSEGQTTTFTASASGTAPLAYQWQRNGIDVAGATSTSYTTGALTLADNGTRWRLRVGNSAGSVTSTEAVVTVQAATGGLIGRAWSTGQLLETDDNAVRDRVSGIDDAGRVTVVFRKSNGTRDVMYATRGTPNTAGTTPSWTTPVVIDLLAGTPVSTMGTSEDYDLMVLPGGNAVAYWFHTAPCSASTYRTSGSCRYYYMARFTAVAASWSAPELITDAPAPKFTLRANDRGDIALLGTSWVRSDTTSSTNALALFMRNPGETSFRRRLFNAEPVGSTSLELDGAGNLLLAAEYLQGGTTDLVAYRGTVASGLGAPAVLDTRGAVTNLVLAKVGVNGQQAVLWTQNNGSSSSTFAATAPTPTTTFTVTDLGFANSSNLTLQSLFVTDAGQVIYIESGFFTRFRRDWTAALGWSGTIAVPSNELYARSYASNRRGDILVSESGTGAWGTYDAERGVMVRSIVTGTQYVLGFSKGAGLGTTALSMSGVGFISMQNALDVLPTPAAPAGDGRPAVINLWGAFLK